MRRYVKFNYCCEFVVGSFLVVGHSEAGVLKGRGEFFAERIRFFVGGRAIVVHVDEVFFLDENQLAGVPLVANLLQINLELKVEILIFLLS